MSGNLHTISWDASQYVEGDVGDLYIGRDLRSLGAVDFTTGGGGRGRQDSQEYSKRGVVKRTESEELSVPKPPSLYARLLV